MKSAKPPFHLVIKSHGQTIYEKDLESGAYLVNLSDRYDVWFAQIGYGWQLRPDAQLLDRGKLGVYRLGKRRSPTVFKFDRVPPTSVRESRISTAQDEYFLLGTYTEKGIALRRKLAQLDGEKNKGGAEQKEFQKVLGDKMPEGGVVIGRPEDKTK